MNPISLSYNSIVRDTNLYNSHHNEVKAAIKAAKVAIAEVEMNFLTKCDPTFNLSS